MTRYMSASEVTATLGISAATLYSYVSRGLVRSEETGSDHRARRYHAEDVERLMRRKEGRRDPAKSAREALHWGEPVLESSITRIGDGALYYRGHDTAVLAGEQTFEAVAALLWAGELSAAERFFGAGVRGALGEKGTLHPLAAMQIALALAADEDLSAYDLTAEGVMRTGAQTVHLLARVCAGGEAGDTTAGRLASAWRTRYVRLLDAALILCADHELNPSSFAARVIASTGATPYAVVAGALAALSGHRHGGHTQRVSALLDELDRQGDVLAVVRARLARGDGVPGFGHTLYPEGDPRAAALLALLGDALGDAPDGRAALATADALQQATGKAATIDMALVLLERALHLPRDAAFMLFAVGRSAGWIAHAIEQYARPELLRPRAKYVGG